MQRRTRARALTHTQLTHTAEVARCLSSQPQSVYPAVTTFMPSGLLKSHRNRAAISPLGNMPARGCCKPAEARLKMLRLGVGGLLIVPLLLALFYHDDDSEVREAAGAFTIVLTNYIGDSACAMTGALAAGMEGMDLLGCVIVGFVTALGGGTFRDLLLGRQPIAWLVDWDEALLCVSVRVNTHAIYAPTRTVLRACTQHICEPL